MGNGEFENLSNLCVVRTGQTFKGALIDDERGDVSVILPKDIVDSNILGKTIRLRGDDIPALENHLLKRGEILIANKGSRFSTYIYDGYPEKAVATTGFYVISVGERILPEYLFWYLSQKEASEYLSLNKKGGVIPSITKPILNSLMVPVIPIRDQKDVCEFVHQEHKEYELMIELAARKMELSESIIWEKIYNIIHGKAD